MSKTPITILQELCAKRNFRDLPIFEDFAPTAPSEYRFHVKCTALGKEVIGYGLTKKIAKHMSAQMILQKYSDNSMEIDDDELNIPQVVDRNSITDLLDICAQRNFAKPDFKEISVVGKFIKLLIVNFYYSLSFSRSTTCSSFYYRMYIKFNHTFSCCSIKKAGQTDGCSRSIKSC